jgi:hypothetical protein
LVPRYENDAKDDFERKLKVEFHIEFVWQGALTPETSMLDLGRWMYISFLKVLRI